MKARKTLDAPDILNKAIEVLEQETGLRMRVEETHERLGDCDIDAVLVLDKCQVRLAAEVKRWAAQVNIGALINHVKRMPMQGCLVADYINPNMAEKLRAQKVPFIDTAGNAYLDFEPVYVHITGRKIATQGLGAKTETNRAFDRTGLKVIFAFLCQPQLVNAPYREIAEAAGVALGTVGWVMNGLTDTGFIEKAGRKKERKLTQHKRLLDRWVETYPEKLRPKVHLGDFQAADPYWWKNFDIEQYRGCWGEEIAADRYTDYLKPATATVYLPKGEKVKFLAQARLRAATNDAWNEGGVVKVYEKFWHDMADWDIDMIKPGLVPPVLAYADLIATGDPRNLETATMIYDQYIDRYQQEG